MALSISVTSQNGRAGRGWAGDDAPAPHVLQMTFDPGGAGSTMRFRPVVVLDSGPLELVAADGGWMTAQSPGKATVEIPAKYVGKTSGCYVYGSIASLPFELVVK